MTNFIPADKLKEEIKRQIKVEIEECHKSKHTQLFKFGRVNALENLIPFIDSLQQEQQKMDVVSTAKVFFDALSKTPYNNKPITDAQIIVKQLLIFLETPSKYNPDAIVEQPEVDLEKELTSYYNEHFSPCENGVLLSEESGRELDCNDYESIARHFYELGLNSRKEE